MEMGTMAVMRKLLLLPLLAGLRACFHAGITSSILAEQVPLFMSAKHAFMSANDGLQVPFFVAVERLEQEKRHLLKERETFKRALMRRQVN